MAYPAGHRDHPPTGQSDEPSGLRFARPMHGRDTRDHSVEAFVKSLSHGTLPCDLEAPVGSEWTYRRPTGDDFGATADVGAAEHDHATSDLTRVLQNRPERGALLLNEYR